MLSPIFTSIADHRVVGRCTYDLLESEVSQKKANETSVIKRYYISDENFPKAAYYNMLARGHWTIENLLH